MNRLILKAPASALKTVCKPVTDFGESLKTLAGDLIDTLKKSRRAAVGLSSNQIGDLRRVFVMDLTSVLRAGSQAKPLVFVNPCIVKARGEQRGVEGCLSLDPSDDCSIVRHKIINWKAFDLNGEAISGKMTGFDARVFQHEIDHLDGILITDRAKMQKGK